MICPKCNSQIPDDARECPKCHLHQTFTEPLDFSARNEHTIEHKQKKSATSANTKNITFIMIALLLIAIMFLVYYFLGGNNGDGDVASKVLPVAFEVFKF